jgi:hypothetical protein
MEWDISLPRYLKKTQLPQTFPKSTSFPTDTHAPAPILPNPLLMLIARCV